MFQVLHDEDCELDAVQSFVTKATSGPVAELGPDVPPEVATTFFHQHAALETAAVLGLNLPEQVLTRFQASDFFHVQISTLRYLTLSKRDARYAEIAEFVCNDTKHPLARRFGLLFLEDGDAREESGTLESCIDSTDDESLSLVNIMDPRISTRFPNNLKESVRRLLEQWESLD